MYGKLLIVLAIVLMNVLSVAAQSNSSDSSAFTVDEQQEFRDYVETTLNAYAIPGAAVAVIQDGQIIMAEGFGVSDLESNAPVTSDTIFQLGSLAKSINSSMIATLVDQGVIDWDQPIVEVMPDFQLADADRTAALTLRDLIGFRSGIANNDLETFGVPLSVSELITSIADEPFNAVSGEMFDYNNNLASIGGFIAASAVNDDADLLDTYIDLVEQRIFAPAGMESASLSQRTPDENLATGYLTALDGSSLLPTPFVYEASQVPAGMLTGTVLDMAQFLLMQVTRGVAVDGTQVISTSNLLETWTPGVVIAGGMQLPGFESLGYGMGWFIDAYNGMEIISVPGNAGGFTAYMAILPDSNTGIVIMTNKAQANVFSLALSNRLVELVYDFPQTFDAIATQINSAMQQQLAGMSQMIVGPATVETLGAYVGNYTEHVSIEVRDDEVWLNRGNFAGKLYVLADGSFISEGIMVYGLQITQDGLMFGNVGSPSLLLQPLN
ncbi:MAG: beta-lactamase family protein [Anaerolineae bacterium]|nr:beta-lactamase family protein [Anaerolineae bacterium]